MNIFVIGYTSGVLFLAVGIYDNLVLGNVPNMAYIALSVTLILGTTITVLSLELDKARQVFKKHNIDWKKEVLQI